MFQILIFENQVFVALVNGLRSPIFSSDFELSSMSHVIFQEQQNAPLTVIENRLSFNRVRLYSILLYNEHDSI